MLVNCSCFTVPFLQSSLFHSDSEQPSVGGRYVVLKTLLDPSDLAAGNILKGFVGLLS